MPISRAWKFSEAARRRGLPPAAFLRVNYRKYSEASRRIMEILRRHAPRVEEASIDEAYFDLSFAGSVEAAVAICREIKEEIQTREHSPAPSAWAPTNCWPRSPRISGSPTASRWSPPSRRRISAPLPVRQIPGIGPQSEKFLAGLGIKLVRDLKRFSPLELKEMFGKWGPELYERIRGRHESPLVLDWEPKSVGEQETFARDNLDLPFIFTRLWLMCREVFQRVQAEGFHSYRTVVVTVRFADFATSLPLPYPAQPSESPRTLRFEAMKLLMPFLDRRENPRRKMLRLIGVRVEKLGK